MYGGKLCGCKMSVNVFPCDIIEWLHGIHVINELYINICPRDVHVLNELLMNFRPCVVHGMNELSVKVTYCDIKESKDLTSESGIHGMNGPGPESDLNVLNVLNGLWTELSLE